MIFHVQHIWLEAKRLRLSTEATVAVWARLPLTSDSCCGLGWISHETNWNDGIPWIEVTNDPKKQARPWSLCGLFPAIPMSWKSMKESQTRTKNSTLFHIFYFRPEMLELNVQADSGL